MRTRITIALFGTCIAVGAALATPLSAFPHRTSLARSLPGHATRGPDGFTVCGAILKERNKFFYSGPFAADSLRSNEFALSYAKMLRDESYAAASMYAPKGSPPPELTVDCRWHATKSLAADWNKQLVSGAQRNGMAVLQTAFAPAGTTP